MHQRPLDPPAPLRFAGEGDAAAAAVPGAVADARATGRRPRVALVSINYFPEQVGIAVSATGLAEYLARRGLDVTVYTAFPYYPAWAKTRADRSRWFARDTRDGVRLRRSYLWVPARPTAPRRMLHELSFAVSATLNYLLGPRADCTVVVSPPLALGIPIALAARLKGGRVIFHVQDLQPDAALELGMLSRGILARALLALEKLTYRAVHCVSAISDGMRERIVAKGVRADRVAVFRNGADDERVRPRPGATALRAEWGLEGRIVALYAGNLGVKQGLHTLLEAAQLLRDRADIAFVVVGDGGEKARLVEQARRRALCNVSFRPLQPGARLEELLATADLAVITQRKAVRDIVFPTKVAYIMCSGRPIVAAAAGDSELARAIDASGGGVVVEPEAPQALAAAIAALAAAPDLRDRLGASGRRYAERHFSHRVVFGEFADHITALAASRPASFP